MNNSETPATSGKRMKTYKQKTQKIYNTHRT